MGLCPPSRTCGQPFRALFAATRSGTGDREDRSSPLGESCRIRHGRDAQDLSLRRAHPRRVVDVVVTSWSVSGALKGRSGPRGSRRRSVVRWSSWSSSRRSLWSVVVVVVKIAAKRPLA
eukprot:1510466-Heterocapsa_arctica.AAC.1